MRTTETNTNNDTTSNSIKVLLDQNNIPIEELLGSVTTYNNVEGSDSKSQQLRTSARVFKKLKLESTPSAAPTVCEKKEAVKEDPKPEVKRNLRPSWSQEDKNLFFEALNEFGKDFEAIYTQISTKLKKRGLPDSVIKTKDQVRHFYYRTWHKISKHLKFSEDVKKLAQEIYGLINYGEFRKKIGSVNEKACMKLNELMYRGYVSVRLKGKSVRIKTPMCRALRKLNQLDEKHDELKLPLRINVDLVPKEMGAWLQVQSVSQNPRIRASLPLHKRLHTLIKFLCSKWKTVEASAYENLTITPLPHVAELVPDKKTIDETKAILDPLLRLSPPSNVQIEPAIFNLSEYLTNNNICLNAFEEKVGVKSPGELLWVTKGARKGGTKRARNESTGEKSSPTSKHTPVNNIDNNENCISDIDCINDDAVNNILMLQSHQVEETDEDVKDKIEICDEITLEEIREKNINVARQGWNISACGNLCIGELYLMFGSNSQLVLEYSWDLPESVVKNKVEGCDKSEEIVCTKVEKDNGIEDNVTGSLQRLLSISKLHNQRNISYCACGHICGSNTKTNVHNKTTLTKAIKLEAAEKPTGAESIVAVEPTSVTSVVPILIQSPILGEYTTIDTFRRPLPPDMDSLRAQLDQIKPRYCNRKGRRPRSKQIVVERRLPLLPNTIDNSHQIVQMNIISSDDRGNTPRTITPTIINIDKAEHNISVEPGASTPISINESVNTALSFGSLNVNQSSSDTATVTDVINITDNAVTPSRVSSPTSISNLLDMAIANQSAELENKNSLQSFAGLLSCETPATSPSHILKENENQWLNSEVADFSFSSFLGHLESPAKPQTSLTVTDDNHLSQDVDAQLQSLLTESSIDYVSKFADLAAQVNQMQENN